MFDPRERITYEASESSALDQLVRREVERRAAILVRAYDLNIETEKSMKRLGMDVVTVSADGTENKAYSKAQFETRKKAQEKLDKIAKLCEAVKTDAGKWSELDQLAKEEKKSDPPAEQEAKK
jgi:hypothetical protein